MNLFAPEDIENVGKTGTLDENGLNSLRAAAVWINTFVVRPHEDFSRAGPAYPFVPVARERNTSWLAPEWIAGWSVLDIVFFADLLADRAKPLVDHVPQQLGVAFYLEDGRVLGALHESDGDRGLYPWSAQSARGSSRFQSFGASAPPRIRVRRTSCSATILPAPPP